MSPASEGEPDWMETAWQYVLRLDQVLWDGSDPAWLDYPAMMKIPVSSPAVLGRLKGFCKPYDFVLAPLLLNDKLDPEERAEKPILITRFTKHANEWLDATYYNVRTCDKCRITVGKPRKGLIPVKSYRQILNQYLYHPEYKFAGPNGRRKLEQGPIDHDIDFKCKVYENGRVVADAETLRQLAGLSERQIRKGTGVCRDAIRLIRHGKAVKRSTYEKVINFLRQKTSRAAKRLNDQKSPLDR